MPVTAHRLTRLFAALVLAALAALPVRRLAAQTSQGIVATVNDDAISQRDLESRIALVIATSNLEDTPETRKRLAPEVLRTLVDDALKRQEMRRQNIKVSQEEIDRALAQIASQLHVPPGDLPEALASRGVSMNTLIDQVQSELGWVKAVTLIAGDRAQVRSEEVDEEISRARSSAGGPEYRLAEIFLAVDDPEDQARVEEQAIQLVSEARSGANFASLARTFSQGPSASSGGDLGWVPQDELGKEIEAVVSRLQPGQVSDPIRARGGYFVLLMNGRRSGDASQAIVTVMLRQVFLPLQRPFVQAQAEAAAARVRGIADGATNCDELERRAVDAGANTSTTPGAVDIQQLPPELQQVIKPLARGQTSPPILAAEGVVAIMVCDRQEQAAGQEQRSDVERRLRDQRLGAVARRQLRDLRRQAMLDVRQ